MSLEEKLAEIRAASAKRIPEEKRAIMQNAVKQQRESGIVDKAIKVGDRLPPFTLKNTKGEEISSAALLQKGPLVVTAYRGHW